MGLYDREYYREDHARREFWQIGPVTLGLIAVTVGVFLMQLVTINTRQYTSAFDPLLYWGGFSVDRILDGQVWRLVTSLFLHHPANNIWLIGLSMIVLAYCGRNVEGTYGPKEMFWYYVFTGLVTQLAFLAVCVARPLNFVPPEYGYGSGGPVAAVMVLFAIHSPNSKVPLLYTSVRAGPLAAVVVFANLALFFMTGFNHFQAIPVLAGASFALVYHQSGWRVSNWVPDLPGLRKSAVRSPVKSRPLFQSPEKETPTPSDPASPYPELSEPIAAPVLKSAATVSEHLEAQLDQVLSKVAKFGKASLTPTENEILLKASEVYKNRRK